MELVYDPEGNVTTRRVATGSFATGRLYDDENQLTQLSDPADDKKSFYWDNHGELKTKNKPQVSKRHI